MKSHPRDLDSEPIVSRDETVTIDRNVKLVLFFAFLMVISKNFTSEMDGTNTNKTTGQTTFQAVIMSS
ncbi:hypothetical protein Btru_063440 [Bulinus truncatus]|nr:hypothetical protein Btru_063440 [Bulinus truncatus]